MLPPTPALCTALMAGGELGVNFVVIDPLLFCDAAAASAAASASASASRSSSSSASAPLISKAIAGVQAWLKTNPPHLSLLGGLENTTQIVSIDWLCQCIAYRQLISPRLSPLFSMPTDPLLEPTTYKKPANDGGERFLVRDVVSFRPEVSGARSGSSPGPVLLGRIEGFYRASLQAEVRVRIMQLDAHKVSKQQQQQALSYYQISPSSGKAELSVPASRLVSKVVVLTTEAARSAYYIGSPTLPEITATGPELFACCPDWQEEEESQVPPSQELEAPMMHQMSQDV